MKVTELRIGNYAFDSDRNDPYFYQIVRIETKEYTEWNSGDKFNVIGKIEGSENGYYEMNPSPIPLTEEWLERFGFEKTYSELSYCEYDLGKIGVEINSDKLTVSYNYGSDVEWVNFNHIKHVHQLQNLYHALTGEELTIKE